MLSQYERLILKDVAKHGGFYNAHAHLDRAGTLDGKYLAHIGTNSLEASNLPLSVKQDLVGDLHRGLAYTPDDLYRRMKDQIERQIAFGVTRFDTNIDATPDLPENGMLAINTALRLKEEYKDQIKIRIAPTPIFGFKKDDRDSRDRWEVFREAAKACDFLSLLPEKDDYAGTNSDGRIGFKRHLKWGLDLAEELGMEVQFHLDQMNLPQESGTMRLLEVLEAYRLPKRPDGSPSTWIIHGISVSAKDEQYFVTVCEKMRECNVGVICCPSAALSMRQIRSVVAPTHNSIARVPEFIKMRIPVRLGTDNIEDVFVPMGNGDMLTEVMEASASLRLASPSLWGKLAAAVKPNNVDINQVGRVLYEDRKACMNYAPAGWVHASE